VEAAPYLGPVLALGGQIIQRVNVSDLLPEGWAEILFPAEEVAA
jgi:hypothetical protein